MAYDDVNRPRLNLPLWGLRVTAPLLLRDNAIFRPKDSCSLHTVSGLHNFLSSGFYDLCIQLGRSTNLTLSMKVRLSFYYRWADEARTTAWMTGICDGKGPRASKLCRDMINMSQVCKYHHNSIATTPTDQTANRHPQARNRLRSK